MVNKKLIRVPDGIIRGNVTFVERRKTNSKYNVKFSEKIAAVFNIKFPAFMLEMETIDPDCSVARARAIWQMRSHRQRTSLRARSIRPRLPWSAAWRTWSGRHLLPHH